MTDKPANPLRFGIPSLDELIDRAGDANFAAPCEPATVTIVGPDGVGKSVLTLHLTSYYLWQLNASGTKPKPSLIYVSTDLSIVQAKSAWTAFGLDRPDERAKALNDAYGYQLGPDDKKLGVPFELTCVLPHNGVEPGNVNPTSQSKQVKEPLKFLLENEGESQVFFLDLQSETAGDDWLLLNRVIGSLPKIAEGDPPHLIVIDAIEGLETLAGDRDAYGEQRTRRSRIAQFIRNAKAKRCHMVFVVEEPKTDERQDEQFVADLVLRLRVVDEADYTRRTVEVEKARGLAHVRGQHEFSIRSGKGSATGGVTNNDDPSLALEPRPEAQDVSAI